MIRWRCRQCGEALEAPDSMRNDYLDCANCGTTQPVGGDLSPALVTAAQELKPSSLENASLLAAEIGVRRDRVQHRPALRKALAQTAVGLTVAVLFMIGATLATGSLVMARSRGVETDDLEAATALLSIGWMLGIAWFVGGIIRALFAASKML